MSEYGEDWEKELKKRPKDFLVNFIKNSLLKIKKLEKQNEELIKQIITSCIDEDWSVNDAYDLLEKITGKPIEEV